MDVKALGWILDRFPGLVGFGLALWCIADDRAELGMGFLILAVLSEVMRVLVEVRGQLNEKEDQ